MRDKYYIIIFNIKYLNILYNIIINNMNNSNNSTENNPRK